jgi:hypothetical protein
MTKHQFVFLLVNLRSWEYHYKGSSWPFQEICNRVFHNNDVTFDSMTWAQWHIQSQWVLPNNHSLSSHFQTLCLYAQLLSHDNDILSSQYWKQLIVFLESFNIKFKMKKFTVMLRFNFKNSLRLVCPSKERTRKYVFTSLKTSFNWVIPGTFLSWFKQRISFLIII